MVGSAVRLDGLLWGTVPRARLSSMLGRELGRWRWNVSHIRQSCFCPPSALFPFYFFTTISHFVCLSTPLPRSGPRSHGWVISFPLVPKELGSNKYITPDPSEKLSTVTAARLSSP